MMAKSKYDENFPLMAEDYARQGMIDKEIAKKLGITERTFYRYQLEHSQFCQAIKRGKQPVDIEVENALLKRAKGYEYEEIHTEYRLKGKSDEKAKPSMIRRIKKQIVADVTAQIFWLKNRRPKLWKDKHDVDVSGNLNIKVITAVPRSKKREEKNAKNKKK